MDETRDAVDVLADVFGRESDADDLLDRVDFPRARRPPFAESPHAFWSKVVREVLNGRTAGGLPRLLAEASRLFPHHERLRRLAGLDDASEDVPGPGQGSRVAGLTGVPDGRRRLLIAFAALAAVVLVWVFWPAPEADLARRFSEDCLDRLEPIFDAGTDPSWMATILEAVIAAGLRITVEWEAGVEGEARAAVREAVKQMEGDGVAVEAEAGAEGKTVLAAEGRIVVAYRVASMVPVEK